MGSLIRFAKVACTSKVVKKAIGISLIVGSLLNLINQGDALIGLQFETLNIFKLLFTYLVPYTVTTYTAVSMHLEFNIGQRAIIDAELECKTCHQKELVKQTERIPECPQCGINTKWKII